MIDNIECININSVEDLNNLDTSYKNKILELNISHYEGKKLNVNLNEFINLESLLIHHNLNLIKLPCLDELTKLKYLYCYNNNLIELPSLNYLINLEELWCSSNKLRELPSLQNLINLKQLN